MNARHFTGWVLATALLAGCGQDLRDLESYALEVKSRTSRNIAPIPQIKPFNPFTYEVAGRRDPFQPRLFSREDALAAGGGTGNSLQPDINRPREALEEFPLDALRMLGTLTVRNKLIALVKAPDSLVHRVSIGDHMGQNYGEITQITDSEVTLMEIIPDGFGGWIQRPASVAMVQ
ncbi:MAG: pilus assembly protein PilP [Nevskiales bacterium]|nr:pilus assembly protein PilP [Nevskiales bacterium]